MHPPRRTPRATVARSPGKPSIYGPRTWTWHRFRPPARSSRTPDPPPPPQVSDGPNYAPGIAHPCTAARCCAGSPRLSSCRAKGNDQWPRDLAMQSTVLGPWTWVLFILHLAAAYSLRVGVNACRLGLLRRREGLRCTRRDVLVATSAYPRLAEYANTKAKSVSWALFTSWSFSSTLSSWEGDVMCARWRAPPYPRSTGRSSRGPARALVCSSTLSEEQRKNGARAARHATACASAPLLRALP